MALKEQDAVFPPVTVADQVDDPFYYGHRIVITYDENGEEIYTYQPLTLEDFLDPQEGDHFVQGTLHDEDTEAAKSIFRHLHAANPMLSVYRDLKMVWGIPGLSEPAPDVAVIPNVKDPDKPRGEFDVLVEGTRPLFVLEIVSPRYRRPDRKNKVAIYERAGVEEYVIIDSWLRGDKVSYEVLGYRMVGGRYVEIQPNAQGWVYSAINDVWIGVSEARDRFFVIDAQSDERILSDREARGLTEEQAEAEAAARAKAERQAEAEAAARAKAERQAEAEAAARAKAERQAEAEAAARAKAERQAEAEAAARAQAEARVQALEAEAARLREELERARQR